MKRWSTVLLATILLASGCAGSWAQKTATAFQGLHRSARSGHISAKHMCRDTLEQCKKDQTNPCPALTKCQKTRDQIFKAIDGVYAFCQLGLDGLDTYLDYQKLKDEGKASNMKAQVSLWLASAGEAYAAIYQTLKTFGIVVPKIE